LNLRVDQNRRCAAHGKDYTRNSGTLIHALFLISRLIPEEVN
jgi:hypothetical protein